MPVHDWTRVDAGIFHDFHHAWIEKIKRALNGGLLPADYYALAEQHAAGFGPDVLTLKGPANGSTENTGRAPANGGVGLLLAPPKVQLTAETDLEFYRRKQSIVAVRHVSGDDLVAVVEIVSWGNKSSRGALEAFLKKTGDLLERPIHLLIVDLYPPSPRDPQGIHGAIWEYVTGQQYDMPHDRPLTLAAYDTGAGLRAYAVQLAVGDALTDMPLFLQPRAHVVVPLEATYRTAFAAVPRRWRAVLESAVPQK
jgi:Protein of unknown function (DUF4058)